MNPLYVITCVFNPRRFESRYCLYRNFAKWVDDSGIRLLTVEVAFGERPYQITSGDDKWNVQLRTKHELWHKERMLNLGLRKLATLDPVFQYVAWMDCDVRLARSDWGSEAVHLLQHYAVIQLFGEAASLGPNHQQLFVCPSMGFNFEKYGILDWGDNAGLAKSNRYARKGHPGLGWAFRRDELNDVGGWLDTCINGSGDLHMAGCYSGKWDLAVSSATSPGYRRSIKRYGELCDRYIRKNLSYMPGQCQHFWHGRSKERGYDDRWEMLDRYQFDPQTDLIEDVQGLYKWRINDPRVRAMATEARKSLAARNEDAMEL